LERAAERSGDGALDRAHARYSRKIQTGVVAAALQICYIAPHENDDSTGAAADSQRRHGNYHSFAAEHSTKSTRLTNSR